MSFAKQQRPKSAHKRVIIDSASSVSKLIPPEERAPQPKRPLSAPLKRPLTEQQTNRSSRHNIHQKRIARPATAGETLPISVERTKTLFFFRQDPEGHGDAGGCKKMRQALDGG